MAKGKKSKERTFEQVDANGIGTTSTDLKISDTVKLPVKFRAPSTTGAFQKLVASAVGESLSSLYNAVLRGLEQSAKVKVKNANTTSVTIGGKSIDLMGVPPRVAVQAINARLSSIALLSGDLSAEEKAKMEKREQAWYNAARMLVEGGKATKDGDGLKLAN